MAAKRASGGEVAANAAEGQEEAAGPPKPLRRQSTFLGKLAERAVNAAEKVTGVDLDGDGDVGEDGGKPYDDVYYSASGAALPSVR